MSTGEINPFDLERIVNGERAVDDDIELLETRAADFLEHVPWELTRHCGIYTEEGSILLLKTVSLEDDEPEFSSTVLQISFGLVANVQFVVAFDQNNNPCDLYFPSEDDLPEVLKVIGDLLETENTPEPVLALLRYSQSLALRFMVGDVMTDDAGIDTGEDIDVVAIEGEMMEVGALIRSVVNEHADFTTKAKRWGMELEDGELSILQQEIIPDDGAVSDGVLDLPALRVDFDDDEKTFAIYTYQRSLQGKPTTEQASYDEAAEIDLDREWADEDEPDSTEEQIVADLIGVLEVPNSDVVRLLNEKLERASSVMAG